MKCEAVQALFSEYYDGLAEATEALETHLHSCPGCAADYAAYRQMLEDIRALPVPALPDGFHETAMERVHALAKQTCGGELRSPALGRSQPKQKRPRTPLLWAGAGMAASFIALSLLISGMAAWLAPPRVAAPAADEALHLYHAPLEEAEALADDAPVAAAMPALDVPAGVGAEEEWFGWSAADANGFEPNGFEPNVFEPNVFEPNVFEPERFDNVFEPDGFDANAFAGRLFPAPAPPMASSWIPAEALPMPAAPRVGPGVAVPDTQRPRFNLWDTSAYYQRVLDISITVENLDAAAEAVRAQSGQTLSASVSGGDYRRRAHFQRRVSPQDFAGISEALEALGTVNHRRETRTHMGSQVIDLQARLSANAEALVRLNALMAQSASLEELLAVEGRLSFAESDRDHLQGRLNQLYETTASPYLNISLVEAAEAAPLPAAFSGRVQSRFWGSLHGLVRFMGNVSVFLAGAAIPLLILALYAGLVGLLVRRANRKRGTK